MKIRFQWKRFPQVESQTKHFVLGILKANRFGTKGEQRW
jgi:hypothetical protein